MIKKLVAVENPHSGDISGWGTVREKWGDDLGYHVARITANCDHPEQYARLFAAAPDLLEACQYFLTGCRVTHGPNLQESYERIEAAVKKATEG